MKSFLWSALVLGLVAFAGTARGGDEARAPERITVNVRGSSAHRADAVEVEVTVTGSSEEATEAEKRYRDRLGKVLAAFKGEATTKGRRRAAADRPPPAAKEKAKKKPRDEDEDEEPVEARPAKKKKADEDEDEDAKPSKKEEPRKDEKKKKGDEDEGGEEPRPDLGSPDADPAKLVPVDVREEGLTIGPQAADGEGLQQVMIRRMQGQAEMKTAPTYKVASRVIARINEVSKIERSLLQRRIAGLIDGAVQAMGSDDAPAARVKFLLGDGEGLKKKAYADAMEKAKARAGELAKLAGRALGRVASVRETGAVQEPQLQGQAAMVAAMWGATGATGPAPTAIDLSVDVDLTVEFELVP